MGGLVAGLVRGGAGYADGVGAVGAEGVDVGGFDAH